MWRLAMSSSSTSNDPARQLTVFGRVAQSLADRVAVSFEASRRNAGGVVAPAVVETPEMLIDDGVYDDPYASDATIWRTGLKYSSAVGPHPRRRLLALAEVLRGDAGAGCVGDGHPWRAEGRPDLARGRQLARTDRSRANRPGLTRVRDHLQLHGLEFDRRLLQLRRAPASRRCVSDLLSPSRSHDMRKPFSWKPFTSFFILLSFVVLLLSGVVLYVAPPGRIANWTQWQFGLDKEQWQALHTVFAHAVHRRGDAAPGLQLESARRVHEDPHAHGRVAPARVRGRVGRRPGSARTDAGQRPALLLGHGRRRTREELVGDAETEPPLPHAEGFTLATAV